MLGMATLIGLVSIKNPSSVNAKGGSVLVERFSVAA
jgi:hypothetical protein